MKTTDSLYNKCGGFRTCDACQYNPLCVWCDVEQVCVGGDSDGPFHGECTYFSYQSCYSNGCRSHNRCSSCVGSLTCGWCLNGGTCMDNGDNCDHVLFIHNNMPGTICPVEEINYPELYITNNPSASENKIAEDAERRVLDLRNQSVKIIQEIQELEYSKAKLIEESQINLKTKIPIIQTQELNSELEEQVDRFARIEAEDLKTPATTQEKPQDPALELSTINENILKNQGMM